MGMPTKDVICSKCKGQGPDSMKKALSENCSSTFAVQPQTKQFSLSAFFEERKPQALRAQDDAQCPSESTDCKLSAAIPDTGATATVVLKAVSTDCCSSVNKIEA